MHRETPAAAGQDHLCRPARVIGGPPSISKGWRALPPCELLIVAILVTVSISLPQTAADNDTRDVVFQSTDIVVEKIDIGGNESYQWTIRDRRGRTRPTLKEAKRAARKALKALKKASKQA
ncbi:MAG: hypothetical protein U0168_27530 [Nannocystaceae bacterium]